jgi:ubiquinone/menaquinone biosynthesis C-methylase UbiE
MTKKATLKNDYERMVPEFHKGTLTYAEHLTRYQAAQPLVKDKIVLDIASGSGYGSKLLAETATKVYGVDVDKTSVEYSRQNYGAANIEYKVGDGESIPLADNSVDVVATFETIEHIPDYGKFIKEVKRVLRPDGIAIVSTPNDLEFAEGNHFHLHEFEYSELMSLLAKDFKYIDSYYQGTWKYVAVGPKDLFGSETEVAIPTLNLAPKQDVEYLYFYLVCSNRKIEVDIAPLAALGGHYSDRQLLGEKEQLLERIRIVEEERESLRGYLDKANGQSLGMQAERDKLQKELDDLRGTKTYKIGSKLANLRNAVNHGKK